MSNTVENRYYLKSVHQEIDFFDRKLAHLLKYDVFATDRDRDAAARKLALKRDALVVTARRLAAEGVEFKATELPRSFRPKDEVTAAPVEQVVEETTPVVVAARGESRSVRRHLSAFAGTSMDWEQSVREYMQKKAKA